MVIPAYNEENSITSTLQDLHLTLTRAGLCPYEVIVVDDGSTDNTRNMAQQSNCLVLSHPRNAGYGAALKTGILRAQYDTIVITDSDGTYPVAKIPELYNRYITGFDMVVGAREGAVYRGSYIKWPLRLILRFIVEWTAGKKIPDINSGLRVFSKKKIIPYFSRLCNTFSFTTSATLAYSMTGQFVGYVPISYSLRVGSSHVRLWRDSLRTLQFIVQASIYYNPLKIFLLLAAVCMLGAVFSLFIAITLKIATGFLMAVMLICTSILIFCLGLLADLLRQILSDTSS